MRSGVRVPAGDGWLWGVGGWDCDENLQSNIYLTRPVRSGTRSSSSSSSRRVFNPFCGCSFVAQIMIIEFICSRRWRRRHIVNRIATASTQTGCDAPPPHKMCQKGVIQSVYQCTRQKPYFHSIFWRCLRQCMCVRVFVCMCVRSCRQARANIQQPQNGRRQVVSSNDEDNCHDILCVVARDLGLQPPPLAGALAYI